MLRFVFGEDVFISYSRHDASSYAVALANALETEEPRLSCFLDQWGASASEGLSRPVKRALGQCYVFVLVGSAGAAQSQMVREEVARFARTGSWRRHRPILPVSVGGALDELAWPELKGLNRTRESDQAVRDGRPSEAIIRLVRNSCTFARRSLRVRLLSLAALALLLVSVVAAAYAWYQNRSAVEATALARQQERAAIASSQEAQRQEQEAKENLAKATYQEQLARQNALKAREQERVAEYRLRVSTSQRLAAQSVELLSRQPRLLPVSVLLALQSLQFDLNAPPVEGYESLRQGLEILPRLLGEHRQRGPVRLMAVSPDGRFVVSSGPDDAIRVWDFMRGEVVFERDSYRARSVGTTAVSPDGGFLAVGWGGTLDIWPVGQAREARESAQKPLRIPAPVREPRSAAFSPDGRFFAVVGYGGSTVRVWNVPDWKPGSFDVKGSLAIGFSSDGRSLFSAGHEAIETFSISEPRTKPTSSPIPRAELAGFSADGTAVATTGDDQIARVWAFDSTRRVWTQAFQTTHPGRATAVAASPGGRSLVVASEDGTARIWGSEERRETFRMTHNKAVTAVGFADGGKLLMSASEDGSVRSWESAGTRPIVRLDCRVEIRSLSAIPGGQTIATIGSDGRVRLWSSETALELEAPQMGAVMSDGEVSYRVELSTFSPGGQFALVVVSSGDTTMWDTGTGAETQFSVSEGPAAIALSPAGDVLALGYSPEGVFVRRTDLEETILWRLPEAEAPSALEYDADGTRLAIGDRDGGVRLVDSKTGSVIARVHSGASVEALKFSRDGRYLAVAHVNGVGIWDCQDKPRRLTTLRPEGTARALAFSSDGRFLVTGTASGVAEVREVLTGRVEARIAHEGALAGVTFGRDGRRIATGGRDRVLHISFWRIEDLAGAACDRLQRNLTGVEWRTYLGDQPYRKTCPNIR